MGSLLVACQFLSIYITFSLSVLSVMGIELAMSLRTLEARTCALCRTPVLSVAHCALLEQLIEPFHALRTGV